MMKKDSSDLLPSLLICLLLVVPCTLSFTSPISCQAISHRTDTTLHEAPQEKGLDNEFNLDNNRRSFWLQSAARATSFSLLAPATTTILTNNRPAWAASTRSRSEGYDVQKTDEEWKSQLSQMQYYVLRQGGTESPGYSVLEKEYRSGVYRCAGCGTELFSSADKFSSGTGWPSFARGIPGNVETEKVDPITANLAGAELRCQTCGGHLGDVFQDGFLFVGTEAFKSGKRYCIDGAALVFEPSEERAMLVRGDIEQKRSEPSWMSPPSITPQPVKTA